MGRKKYRYKQASPFAGPPIRTAFRTAPPPATIYYNSSISYKIFYISLCCLFFVLSSVRFPFGFRSVSVRLYIRSYVRAPPRHSSLCFKWILPPLTPLVLLVHIYLRKKLRKSWCDIQPPSGPTRHTHLSSHSEPAAPSRKNINQHTEPRARVRAPRRRTPLPSPDKFLLISRCLRSEEANNRFITFQPT